MIIRGQETRNRLLDGMFKVSDVVGSTLGYRGRTVLIQEEFKIGHRVTKDGVTVANSIKLEDELENIGGNIIKGSANRTLLEVGDNTTTSTILTYKMCKAVNKELAIGKTPNDISKTLERDREKVLDYIKKCSVPVKDENDIYSIAYVSSNNSDEIASIIRDVYKSTSKNVAIDVRPSDSTETTFEVLKGYTLEQSGYSNSTFINKFDKGRVEYDDPDIYVFNGKIRFFDDVLRNRLFINSNREDPNFKPMVIICEDIEDSPLEMIIESCRRGSLHAVCVVKTHLIHEDRKNAFIDVTKVTGAEYSDEGYGRIGSPGTCRKVVIDKDSVIFIDGPGDTTNYLKDLKKQYKDTKNVFLEKRILSLESTAAVINVGGILSTEISEKVDRIDDAVRAVKSSLEEGYCPGGSSVYIFASKELGVSNIVKESLLECYKVLMKNAGLEPMYYLDKIHDKGYGYSYNLNNYSVSNMLDDNIVDTAKGLRISFENAISTAINFANIDSFVS